MSTEAPERPPGSRIAVWVDRELDTGSGLAEEICPKVFRLSQDAYTHTVNQHGEIQPADLPGIVVVPVDEERLVIEAALEQPEENIYLHYVTVDADGLISGFFN